MNPNNPTYIRETFYDGNLPPDVEGPPHPGEAPSTDSCLTEDPRDHDDDDDE